MNNFSPNNEQIDRLANEVRSGRVGKILKGKDLLKPSLEYLLLLDSNQRDMIDVKSVDSATNEIWERLTTPQKNSLDKLANNINKLRNSDTLDLISRINTPQIANTDEENSFYNGINFSNNENFEFLILPLGMVYEGPFQ
ncbi:hypothetical protein RclHR1_13410007 [Rhizophagus clarus]|uniref:Uncharacterized protein n=1 Tax=Rhizophagus clarus TaxID=94130 RepID=A0A2Z6QQF3_9GLOM|nr:hypothetical protein RclHR1_13410007 [Rhizophagus clarus]GES95342.1 hypothetical protein GLOIN_2v1669197 [Rhizophagus clarus]